ncbi:MAG: DUF1080 domain-containing protein [Fimbriimonadales bacterium]|nr:DUF1080 domain-containing protein [Fimbriimonadales bacterium]
MDATPFLGRWDVTIARPGKPFPTWFEIEQGPDGLRGRLVGEVGSARPIERFELRPEGLFFALKPQYEPRSNDLEFLLQTDGDGLKGTFLDNDGATVPWTAKRAPDFAGRSVEAWGEPIDLIADGLDAWEARWPEAPFRWTVRDGQLVNEGVGTDLVTRQRFGDFRLVAEYSYPEGSNSGIYLRGRYEMQILDDAGGGNGVGNSGAIYGFLAPSKNAANPAGKWQRAEIELVGRTVTIVLNGETVIDRAEIPGITGGALDSDEAEPGPLFLQGDHGPVTFRTLLLTPAR